MSIIEEHYGIDESIVGKHWGIDGLSEGGDPRGNKGNKADLLDAMNMTSEEEDMEVDFAAVFAKVRELQDPSYEDKLTLLKNLGYLLYTHVEGLRGEETLFGEDLCTDLVKVYEGSVSDENLVDDMLVKVEELIPDEDTVVV